MSQQTSKKTGVASSSEKQANTQHSTQPMPATQPKPGAFGNKSHEILKNVTRPETTEKKP